MFTLLESLHGLLMFITEDYSKHLPECLRPELDALCIKLGKYLDEVG